MRTPIIGLMGKAGCGKGEAINWLRTYGFCEVNFADPLKRMLLYAFPTLFTIEMLWGPSENRKKFIPLFGCDVRTILQRLGTELIRQEFNENLWASYGVDVALNILKTNQHYSVHSGLTPNTTGERVTGVLIGDCRFHNEAREIRDAGGIILKITRPVSSELQSEQQVHQSETEMDSIKPDVEVVNDSTLSAYHLALSLVVTKLDPELKTTLTQLLRKPYR